MNSLVLQTGRSVSGTRHNGASSRGRLAARHVGAAAWKKWRRRPMEETEGRGLVKNPPPSESSGEAVVR